MARSHSSEAGAKVNGQPVYSLKLKYPSLVAPFQFQPKSLKCDSKHVSTAQHGCDGEQPTSVRGFLRTMGEALPEPSKYATANAIQSTNADDAVAVSSTNQKCC